MLIALRFYAFGCYQRPTGQDFLLAVSQSTVCRCIRKVTRALCAIKDEFIKFPSTVAERTRVEAGYVRVLILVIIYYMYFTITTMF